MSKKILYCDMTVNERLFVSGMLNTFEAALKRKDKEEIIKILKEVLIDDLSIKEILNKHKIPC